MSEMIKGLRLLAKPGTAPISRLHIGGRWEMGAARASWK